MNDNKYTPPPEPEPALLPEEGNEGALSDEGLYYANVNEFVEDFLSQIYDRSLGRGLTWCTEWWKHPEAVFYITALWHAWEGARASSDMSAMASWSVYYLFPIMDRLMAENGPFKGCQPDDGTREGVHRDDGAPHPGRVLPTSAPPPRLLAERP